ncbi:MAG: DUF3810 domain-containing protein [Pyrinomonadaceae bacterium]
MKHLSESSPTSFRFSPFYFLAAHRRRWSIPFGLLCAAFVVQLVAGFRPDLTERLYSRGLYTHLAQYIAFINKFFGFSVAEMLLLLLLLGIVAGAVWLAREILLRRLKWEEWRRFLSLCAVSLLWAAGIGTLLFLFVWGLNYERQRLIVNLQLERRQASADELETICRNLIAGINQNYEDAHASLAPINNSSSVSSNTAATSTATTVATGRTLLPLSRAQLYEALESAYERTPLPGVANNKAFGQPKPIRFSRVLTRLGISGMFFPFTGEANFNAEQPDCDLPFAIAHEMAHQRGFAREDEANFIAFLVCANSTDAYVRYSGYLNSLYVVGALARVAPERLANIYRTLGAGPRADLFARYVFWTNYQGKLSATSYLINNAYLKINRIKSGAKNYNEAYALIVGYYLKQMNDKAK